MLIIGQILLIIGQTLFRSVPTGDPLASLEDHLFGPLGAILVL